MRGALQGTSPFEGEEDGMNNTYRRDAYSADVASGDARLVARD
jgi:hypothetical protein